LLLAVLLFARGMDFLSTWVATPNLVLEANPIARKLGWRLGLVLNLVLGALFALWPLPAIVVITTSLLVAARNFQSAWLMRSMGEQGYRAWMTERMFGASRSLFFFCLFAQSGLVGMLGAGLMYFSQLHLVPFAVGMGLVTYAIAILVYSSLSVWRIRSRPL
jgi:hypothetical protein